MAEQERILSPILVESGINSPADVGLMPVSTEANTGLFARMGPTQRAAHLALIMSQQELNLIVARKANEQPIEGEE